MKAVPARNTILATDKRRVESSRSLGKPEGIWASSLTTPIKQIVAFTSLCVALFSPQVHASSDAAASKYPTQPIRLVLGYTPGGSVDAVARVIAPKLGDLLGQTVVIDYRAGAAGIIGARAVANAPPDGYTLHLIESATLVVLPGLQDTKYDPEKSFTPISTLAMAGFVLAANPKFPATSLESFNGLLKSAPGQYHYATSGIGSVGHVAMEMLSLQQGLKAEHVPYKGGGPAMSDVMGGQVPLIVSSMAPAIPQVRAGTVRPIAITSAKRSSALPDLPTVAEQGLPGFEAVSWYALVGPAGMPEEIVDKIGVAVNKVIQDEDVRRTLNAQGFEAVEEDSAGLATRINKDLNKWKSVIADAGITME